MSALTGNQAMAPPARSAPTLAQALRYWVRLGFVNFGGPAGQIALMHDDLVEKKGWIGHGRFMHALNYCMLLPGPEAMQLATYIGWLLHGTLGGVLAGLFFVLPGAALMLGLSLVYAQWGDVAWVEGVFYGLRPAVVAVVAAAVLRIGKKGLRHPAQQALAAAAFVAIFSFEVPFPAIVLGAAAIGWLGSGIRSEWFAPAAQGPNGEERGAVIDDAALAAARVQPSARRALGVLVAHAVLWAAPTIGLGLALGFDQDLVTVGVFFSIAAMVTFGGAYAVLAYVAQAAVTRYAWLSPHDMTVGLGLAESTPGPLILTVQFVGYMAGANHPPPGWSPVLGGTVASLLTLWVTFVPCFLWILLGAPYVERLRGHRRLDGALTALTAAVVGVVLNLAVWLALRVLFAQVEVRGFGPLVLNVPLVDTLDPVALVLAALGFAAIVRLKWSLVAVIAGGALVGTLHHLVAG